MAFDAGQTGAVPVVPTAVRWEYLTHAISVVGFFTAGNVDPREVNEALNRYGSDGWELVSTFDTAGANGGTKTVVLIFKRPVAAQRASRKSATPHDHPGRPASSSRAHRASAPSSGGSHGSS